MSIIRVEHKQRYAIIANATLQDQNLSWEALGMLVYLLSKPDSWEISPAALQKERNGGRDKIYRILNELIKFGYVKRTTQHNSKGHISYDYLVHEIPHLDNPNPCPENPFTGNPYTENQDTILNTEDHKVPIFSEADASVKVDPIIPPVTPPIDPKPPKPAPKPKPKEPKPQSGKQLFITTLAETWKISYGLAGTFVKQITEDQEAEGKVIDYDQASAWVTEFYQWAIIQFPQNAKMTNKFKFSQLWKEFLDQKAEMEAKALARQTKREPQEGDERRNRNQHRMEVFKDGQWVYYLDEYTYKPVHPGDYWE